MADWLKHILALLTGGVIWEGVKFVHPIIAEKIKSYRQAQTEFHRHIEPILKSADELYGKLYSLAEEDFATFINVRNSRADDIRQNQKYVYYLFAQFWAQLEYLRLKSQYYSISSIPRGKELIKFIETIESRQYRILDRSVQRIIGESLIEQATGNFKIMSLNQFTNSLGNAASLHNTWILQLENKCYSVNDKKQRQVFLRFGVILVALINHFDPKFRMVRKRDVYINKLSRESINKIKRQLLGKYLPFLKNKTQYFKK